MQIGHYIAGSAHVIDQRRLCERKPLPVLSICFQQKELTADIWRACLPGLSWRLSWDNNVFELFWTFLKLWSLFVGLSLSPKNRLTMADGEMKLIKKNYWRPVNETTSTHLRNWYYFCHSFWNVWTNLNGISVHTFSESLSMCGTVLWLYSNVIKHSQHKNGLIVDTVVNDTVFYIDYVIVSVLQRNCSTRSSMRTPVVSDTNMICFQRNSFPYWNFYVWIWIQFWYCLILWIHPTLYTFKGAFFISWRCLQTLNDLILQFRNYASSLY